MNIDFAEFVVSAARLEDYPREPLREIALVGRSNVGKSALINALVRRPVARTSGTPGKTRLVNFYRVRPVRSRAFYLVDLPGFGYTDSRAARGAFDALTRTYFESRAGVAPGPGPRAAPAAPGAAAGRAGAAPGVGRLWEPRLACALLLVDSRHPGLAIDVAAETWLGTIGVPCLVVATKVDKVSRSERASTVGALEQAFQGRVLPVSAATGENLDELWRQILPCVNPTPPR